MMSDIGDTRCYLQIIYERANQRYGSLLRSLGGLTRLANQSQVYGNSVRSRRRGSKHGGHIILELFFSESS